MGILLMQLLFSSSPVYALGLSRDCGAGPTIRVVGAAASVKVRVVSSAATRRGDAVLVSDVVEVTEGAVVRFSAPPKLKEGVSLIWASMSVDGVSVGVALLDASTCVEVIRTQ